MALLAAPLSTIILPLGDRVVVDQLGGLEECYSSELSPILRLLVWLIEAVLRARYHRALLRRLLRLSRLLSCMLPPSKQEARHMPVVATTPSEL